MAEPEARTVRGRYRKVEVRTWGDEKFRALTRMPPSGQGLWLFLITGPHTGPIPGLFRAGRAAMAEELEWETEAFDKAFGEVFRQGMAKADFKARVVWVPKAIKHNKPESPNVVRGWASEFDLIPECPLKWEALSELRACIYGLGESFAKAFDEAFGKALPKAMANQEQEQEQEQEQGKASSSLRSDSSPASPNDPPGPAKLELMNPPPADPAPSKAERVAQVTDDAIAAFNACPKLTKAKGGNLPNVSATIGRDSRQANVKRVIDTARAICRERYGSDRITREFWDDYFAEVERDDFHAGRRAGGQGHESWVPDFEFLTRKPTMVKIYDRAVSEGEAA